MKYKDLSSFDYKLSYCLKNVKNIGWIGKNEKFKKQYMNNDLSRKLIQLISRQYPFKGEFWLDRSGNHPCNICGEQSLMCEYEGSKKRLGAGLILIPNRKNYYYACPSMIIHYIDSHNYFPPEEFQRAIFAIDINMSFDADDVFLDLLENESIRKAKSKGVLKRFLNK